MATKAKKPEVQSEEGAENTPIVQPEEGAENTPAVQPERDDFDREKAAEVESAIASKAPLADRLVKALSQELPDIVEAALEAAVKAALEAIGDVSVAELVKTGGATGLVTVISQNPNYNGVLYNVSFRDGKAVCTSKQARRLIDDFQCSIIQS